MSDPNGRTDTAQRRYIREAATVTTFEEGHQIEAAFTSPGGVEYAQTGGVIALIEQTVFDIHIVVN